MTSKNKKPIPCFDMGSASKSRGRILALGKKKITPSPKKRKSIKKIIPSMGGVFVATDKEEIQNDFSSQVSVVPPPNLPVLEPESAEQLNQAKPIQFNTVKHGESPFVIKTAHKDADKLVRRAREKFEELYPEQVYKNKKEFKRPFLERVKRGSYKERYYSNGRLKNNDKEYWGDFFGEVKNKRAPTGAGMLSTGEAGFVDVDEGDHEELFSQARNKVSGKDDALNSFFAQQEKKTKKPPENPLESLNNFGVNQEFHFKPQKIESKVSQKSIFWQKVRPIFGFATAGATAMAMVFGIVFLSYGFQVKDNVKVKGEQVFNDLVIAKEALAQQEFGIANKSFEDALAEFGKIQSDIDKLGGDVVNIFSGLPFLSKASSGKNLVDAGTELTQAGYELTQVIEILANFKESASDSQSEVQSMTEVFSLISEHIGEAKKSLDKAQKHLAKVQIEDLPKEHQVKFEKIQGALPLFSGMINDLDQNSQVFLELFGDNGPRKYMLVFQNNQEMRATGGFIGTYGILSVSNGKVKNLFIDGIFNPDWQLKENVVPPEPIQKISGGWSTHDANWFPHFPFSAEKIAWFYEKTGGPTVDGIVAVTPTVMQKMLEVTGPIRMEEYDVTITAENFIEKTQYEVEEDYDKEENKPKQFLADLAPEVFNRLLAVRDVRQVARVAEVFSSALSERHILLHSFDEEVQNSILDQGWAGEVLETKKDYLMVINSNINGFKTDGVIDEEIFHKAEIEPDGSVVVTASIKRTHNGGDTPYQWWNAVNSNYMRVYVPKDSILISAKGHTRETVIPMLDYEALQFSRDPDLEAQENSIVIDEETGTRIYSEQGKTVFANWVYVSPKETVEVEYKYRLPFKMKFSKEDSLDTYSLLAQKQAGSIGSKFESEIILPSGTEVAWQHPDKLELSSNKASFEGDLSRDQFLGVILKKE